MLFENYDVLCFHGRVPSTFDPVGSWIQLPRFRTYNNCFVQVLAILCTIAVIIFTGTRLLLWLSSKRASRLQDAASIIHFGIQG